VYTTHRVLPPSISGEITNSRQGERYLDKDLIPRACEAQLHVGSHPHTIGERTKKRLLGPIPHVMNRKDGDYWAGRKSTCSDRQRIRKVSYRWCSRFPHAEDDLLLFLVLEISREARYILFLPCSHGFTRAVPEREETTAAALAGEAGWGERQR